MKKVLLAILITLVLVSTAYSAPNDGWSGGGVSVASDCDVATYYPLGRLCVDSDDGKLYKGTGAAIEEIAAGASGTVDVSGTPSNHQWPGWVDADTMKGFTVTASKPVCTDANGDPGVCAGTEGVWQVAGSYSTTTIATDALWDAKGDLVVGTGANTGGRLAVGTAYQILNVNTDTPGWTSTLGATGTRLTAGYFTDLTVTNAIAGGVTGNAGTATALAADPTDCDALGLATAIDASGNLTCSYAIGTDVPGISGTPTDEQLVCWEKDGDVWKQKACGAKTTDNTTASHVMAKDNSNEAENLTLPGGFALTGTTSPTLTMTDRLVATFDGGGSEIADNKKVHIYIPWDCTITGWTILADQAGDIDLGVWSDTVANHPATNADSITDSHDPALSSADSGQDTDVADWSGEALTGGKVLTVNVDSCTTITWASITFTVTR